MPSLFKQNLKVRDDDIVRLNSVGLTLSTIARVLNCHISTVSLRLAAMHVPPADTRHSFMENIFISLELPQQEWLADQLTNGKTINEFVRELIVKAHKER